MFTERCNEHCWGGPPDVHCSGCHEFGSKCQGSAEATKSFLLQVIKAERERIPWWVRMLGAWAGWFVPLTVRGEP